MTTNPHDIRLLAAERGAWDLLQEASAAHVKTSAALDQARKAWNDAVNDVEAAGLEVDDV